MVPAGQPGWSWPRALFWKISISLPEVPLLSWSPLLFSFLTSARGEIPTAGIGDTSSSLAGGSPATPAESPAEPHSQRGTHKAVVAPSLPPARPETADGAENMASGTAAGDLDAWRGPGVGVILTSTQAHLGKAGRPGQAAQISQSSPIRGSHLQKMGLAAPARSKEQV